MTREYLGRFSLLELIMQVLAIGLMVAGFVWVFVGEDGQRRWQWLLLASLALMVLGRFLHTRRLAREYGADDPKRR